MAAIDNANSAGVELVKSSLWCIIEIENPLGVRTTCGCVWRSPSAVVNFASAQTSNTQINQGGHAALGKSYSCLSVVDGCSGPPSSRGPSVVQ
jgi:hypothetical protein